MLTKPKNAVIYCHAAAQQWPDGAIKKQKAKCIAYASAHGFKVQKVFSEYASGIQPKRPMLQGLLNYCADRQNNVTAVISTDRERIARNCNLWKQVVEFLNRNHVTLVFTDLSEEIVLQELSLCCIECHGNSK